MSDHLDSTPESVYLVNGIHIFRLEPVDGIIYEVSHEDDDSGVEWFHMKPLPDETHTECLHRYARLCVEAHNAGDSAEQFRDAVASSFSNLCLCKLQKRMKKYQKIYKRFKKEFNFTLDQLLEEWPIPIKHTHTSQWR